MSERRPERIVGPVFLMLLGLVLLLNNLQILSWSFWREAWRYWPVLLILLGIGVLFSRGRLSRGVLGWSAAAVVVIGLISGTSWLLDERVIPGATTVQREGGESRASLATGEETDAAGRAVVDVKLNRGVMTLSAAPGGHLLSATAAYTREEDRPVLTEAAIPGGSRVEFRSSSRSIFNWGGSGQPVYDVKLGRPGIPHELRFESNSGRADLALGDLQLTDCDVRVNSGSCTVVLGNNDADCRRFSADLNSGQLECSGLGGLGADSYGLVVNSGEASLSFGNLKAGAALDLKIRINSGRITVALPPGQRLAVTLSINSGGVQINGRSYGRGEHRFTAGAGEVEGRLAVQVNSGNVRFE